MKYEVCSQWRTKGDWSAVVVEHVEKMGTEPEYLTVWHSNIRASREHALTGQLYGHLENDFALLEPWEAKGHEQL